EVHAMPTNVLARAGRCAEADVIAVRFRPFLNDHGIGADRQRRPGEDAHALARLHHPGEAGAGLRGAGKFQGATRCYIGRANGVAVHGARIEGRLVVPGDQRFGENPPMRPGQWHGFRCWSRDLGEDAVQGLVDRNHRLKSPDLPPLFSSNWTWLMVMPRSMDLAMS